MFGTRFTIESDLFGYLKDFEVIRPRSEEVDYIHNTYVEIVDSGRGTMKHESGLRRIAQVLRERDGVQAIILAGTELALVFNDANIDFPAIDCARVHIDAIVRRLLT